MNWLCCRTKQCWDRRTHQAPGLRECPERVSQEPGLHNGGFHRRWRDIVHPGNSAFSHGIVSVPVCPCNACLAFATSSKAESSLGWAVAYMHDGLGSPGDIA